MSTRTRWATVLGTFAFSGAVVGAHYIGPATDISAGTGYTAWELCTRVLHSGDDYERVRGRYLVPKVWPLPLIWTIDWPDGAPVEVSTKIPTLAHPRAAMFREGLGCTLLLPDEDHLAVRDQPFTPAPPVPPDDRPWPLGEGEQEHFLVDEALRKVIDRNADPIFAEPSDEPSQFLNATSLLIARDGHLIYERYAEGYTRDQPQLGWSMTKSLTAMIAGLLVHDGKIKLDEPVGLAQWKGTPKQAITWRQLLQMAPGLAWFEGYKGKSDATEMLFSQRDQGAWAADRPLTSTPGTVFTYSTGFSNIAMRAMRDKLGGTHQAIYDLYQQRLFAPLGIRKGVIEPDASGTPVGGARGVLRPVDWLRLGQLIADGGKWNDTQLLPADYVTFLTAASPADAGYGGSMWRQPTDRLPAKVRERLPSELVFFAGHMSQFTIIVPSRRLVVVRTGASHEDDPQHSIARDQAFTLVADLLDATRN